MQATYSAISGFYFGSTGRFQTEALPVPFIHLTLVGRKPICANVNSHHLPKYGWTSDRIKPLEFPHDVPTPQEWLSHFSTLTQKKHAMKNRHPSPIFLIFGAQPKNSHIFKLSQILLSKLHRLSASSKPSKPLLTGPSLSQNLDHQILPSQPGAEGTKKELGPVRIGSRIGHGQNARSRVIQLKTFL